MAAHTSESGPSLNANNLNSLQRANLEGEDNGHNELWHECAGPLVSIPQIGERVFYFPQGQLEQADKETDELFADITLLPISEESFRTELERRHMAIPREPSVSFCKILTPSDTNGHAGVIIFKRHADACFPPLNLLANPPTQELVAKDLHGNEWTFCHVYRGEPKRHILMPAEWKNFTKEKRLVPGDACIFVRGRDGGLYIGGRRAKKPDNSVMPRTVSVQSMKIGVLASAYHALASRNPFTVCYRPRSCTSSFIVPYWRYMESLKNNYVHMKCMMKFEGNDFQEECSTCVVIGSEDLEPAVWPGSTWKCLKVNWADSGRHGGPERVSPWDLIPVAIKLFGSDIVPCATSMNNTSTDFASGLELQQV